MTCTMNLIPLICEKLGIEVGEEFLIAGCPNSTFKLTESGMMFKTNNTLYSEVKSNYLDLIITGKYTIEKLPFLPKHGQIYWSIAFRNDDKQYIRICSFTWEGTCADNLRKNYHIIYRTLDEANADKYNAFKRVMEY